jgi:hypothetical protein
VMVTMLEPSEKALPAPSSAPSQNRKKDNKKGAKTSSTLGGAS